jgi:CHAD domain-containing protein
MSAAEKPQNIWIYSNMKPTGDITAETGRIGLKYWMDCVLRERDYARHDFAPEHIHDLRVALRRCRAIADGYMAMDPHPAWKQMMGELKSLFQQLGSLRDTQVMMEWVERLAPAGDEAGDVMARHLKDQEARFRENARGALRDFGKKKWTSWKRQLSKRTDSLPNQEMVFRQIAVERWSEMRQLHQQALRNRSHASYHRLRIALKKFRYTIENFLPTLYAAWGSDLKKLQDLLGEMHDLQVLWRTALAVRALPTKESRTVWRNRIRQESLLRLGRYREKMLGSASQALVWRSGLPDSTEIKIAAMARLRAWAFFRDPDFDHSGLVAKLALRIFDGLEPAPSSVAPSLPDARWNLEAAALLHDVGKSRSQKKHHLASYRMIRKMSPPLGCSAEDIQIIALIARFHRGAFPRPGQKAFSAMPEKQRREVFLLCGILRLANSFDLHHQRRIQRLEIKRADGHLQIIAPGYSKNDAWAERIAAARHLLEISCELPILISQLP